MNMSKERIDSQLLFCTEKGGTYQGNFQCGHLCFYDACLIQEGETITRYEIIWLNGKIELTKR